MSKHAFVTFLMLNDSYLPGALMLAYGLRNQRSKAELVCLVAEGPSAEARRALKVLFDQVIDVPTIYVAHKRRQERQDRPFWFTRWNALRLGPDGDLGYDYDKIVLLDADVLPLRHYKSLFQVDAPAGIPNEERSNLWDPDASRRAGSGEWSWQRAYRGVCPHGRPIPREITDRVKRDPSNMGLNGSLFVVQPSLAEFRAILEDVRRPEVARLVGDLFDWPDMQYITMRWSGRWHCVDVRYSGFCGFPDLSTLYGTHFAGIKPWYFQRNPQATRRYSRYEDFRYWFGQYRAMLREYPRLGQVGKLRELLRQIDQVTSSASSKRRPASNLTRGQPAGPHGGPAQAGCCGKLGGAAHTSPLPRPD
jgi:hypothetical protein